MFDELAGLFEFRPIGLTLPGRGGREEDVFRAVVDVLFPLGEPGDGRVVFDEFPFTRNVGFGRRGVGTDIEGDVLGTESELERSFAWVFASTTEEPRRFSAEVAELFFAPIDDGVKVGSFQGISIRFDPANQLCSLALRDAALTASSHPWSSTSSSPFPSQSVQT